MNKKTIFPRGYDHVEALPGDVEKARRLFPRGLAQPPGSFRFSVDALLLAAFMTPLEDERRLLDLGTGCGVVAFGMLLRHPALEATGLDAQEELLLAAGQNAVKLGLAGRFTLLLGEAAQLPFEEGGFDLVVCNPPYKQAAKGRVPASPARRLALFEGHDGVAPFCRAAAFALRAGGRLAMIYPAGRKDELLNHMACCGLAPSRLMEIRARESRPAKLVLVEAVKGGLVSREATVLAPLVLHEGEGKATRPHPAALAFCPEMSGDGRGIAFLDNETSLDILQSLEDRADG